MRRPSLVSEAGLAISAFQEETLDSNAIFVSALRDELRPLKKSELRKRAAAIKGVTPFDLEQGDDAEDSRQAFMNLIIDHTPKPEEHVVDSFEVAKIAGLLLFCVEFNDQMLNSFFVSWVLERGVTMSQAGRFFAFLAFGMLGMVPFAARLNLKIGCNRLQYYASWGFIAVRMSYLFLLLVPQTMIQSVFVPMAYTIFFILGLVGTLSETASTTWTLTSVKPDDRIAAMAVLVGTRTVAAFFAPAVGGILYDLGGYATPIIGGGVMFAAVLKMKREVILQKAPAVDNDSEKNSGSIICHAPIFICSVIFIVFFTMLYSCIIWFQPFLKTKYELPSSGYGIVMSLLSCIFIITTMLIDPISKALGNYLTIAFSSSILGFGFLWVGPSPVFSFLPPPSFSTLWVPIVGIACIMMGFAFPMAMIGPMVTNFAVRAGWSPNDAAAQNGMLNMLGVGIAFAIGPAVGGFCVQELGVGLTTTYDAAATLIFILPLIALLSVMDKRSSKHTETVSKVDSKAEALLPKEDLPVLPIPVLPAPGAPNEEDAGQGIFGGIVCCFYSKRVTDYEDYHEVDWPVSSEPYRAPAMSSTRPDLPE